MYICCAVFFFFFFFSVQIATGQMCVMFMLENIIKNHPVCKISVIKSCRFRKMMKWESHHHHFIVCVWCVVKSAKTIHEFDRFSCRFFCWSRSYTKQKWFNEIFYYFFFYFLFTIFDKHWRSSQYQNSSRTMHNLRLQFGAISFLQ